MAGVALQPLVMEEVLSSDPSRESRSDSHSAGQEGRRSFYFFSIGDDQNFLSEDLLKFGMHQVRLNSIVNYIG